MTRLYQLPKESRSVSVSLALGAVTALLIFLLVPLSQTFQPKPQPVQAIEEVVSAPPPSPPPPVQEPPTPPEPEKAFPPELSRPPPLPTLEQLELSLNPGTGGDLGMGISMDFDFRTESAVEMIDLFGFDELDEVPRITRRGRFEYPAQFRSGRGNGYVRIVIIIDPQGHAEVEEVLDYSHVEFIQAVKAFAESSRFSAPLKDGKPVRAKYSWKIEFPLGR